jgi:exopolysaccharide biosynthesis protein
MKKHARIISATLLTAFILTLIPASAAGGTVGAGKNVYTNTKQLADNLQYINTVSWNDNLGREESYALHVSGVGEARAIVMKDDTIYGRFTISAMTEYAASLNKNVLAVVNSDFFSTTTGVPLGIVIEDGEYKSSPENETAIGFNEDGTVVVSRAPDVKLSLYNGGGGENAAVGATHTVTHFNKLRQDSGGLYLLSPAFSTVSSRTNSPGWFVRFRILEGVPTISGTVSLEVEEKLTSDGAVPIGDGYLLLTAANAGGYGFVYDSFTVGDKVTLTATCGDESFANVRWATGGGDVIVENAAITDATAWDRDLLAQSPKTAFGVKADGTMLVYVLDGRNTTFGNGLGLVDLAYELIRQGCVTAVNLDGGGSTAMSIRPPGMADTRVINRPSDGAERKCATYILFVTDIESDAQPRHLAAENDGAIVFRGSSVFLSPVATDAARKPVTTPTDITAVSNGLGVFDGFVYTAGDTAGVDSVTLYSDEWGAYGTAEIMVLDSPTSIIPVAADGRTLADMAVYPGTKISLAPQATYYRKTVAADPTSFTYEVTGGIGDITPDGVFTAGVTGNSGTIVITAGTRSVTLNIQIAGFEDTVGHWAEEFIKILARDGIVNGVTGTTFGPESSIKRCDFVLMLYRAAGEPTALLADGFTDVPTDSYYASAVYWAKNEGITTGVGDGHFDPLSPLTRQQAFAFVYRCLNQLKIDYTDGSPDELTPFADAADIAEYALVPAASLVHMGVVAGADGKLSPGSALTRAQMAKILCVTLSLPHIA